MHMLHRAGQFANDIFLLEASSCQLTPRQFAVLAAVGDEEGLTQTELVERTGIDRSTLADIVARLLSRALIRRRRAKQDGRAYEIRLTESGLAALKQAHPCAEAADERLLSKLPPGKREEFLESLNLIVNHTKE